MPRQTLPKREIVGTLNLNTLGGLKVPIQGPLSGLSTYYMGSWSLRGKAGCKPKLYTLASKGSHIGTFKS